MTKHYELLKEPPNKSSSDTLNQVGEVKVELPSEEESKKETTKHKLMSLLNLLKEFISSKYLKLRNNSCLDCAQLGT